MKKDAISLLLVTIVLLSACAVSGGHAANNGTHVTAWPMRTAESGALLDPTMVPKYVNQLTEPPPVYVPTAGNQYRVAVTSFDQQILPSPLPKTHVFGYGGLAKDAITGAPLEFVQSAPGLTFEAKRGTSIT
jgi:bilirubin oxidase